MSKPDIIAISLTSRGAPATHQALTCQPIKFSLLVKTGGPNSSKTLHVWVDKSSCLLGTNQLSYVDFLGQILL